MKICIKYNDSWENSFSEGNQDTHFNKTRAFIGSSSAGFDKYKEIETNHGTIMGILNRLIGDQRRLFQIRQDPDYFFKHLENKITFDEDKKITDEIVFLRNLNQASDQNGFSGPKLSEKSELFSNQYFDRLWGPLSYSILELVDLIINNVECSVLVPVKKDRIELGTKISLYTEKNKDLNGNSIKINFYNNPTLVKALIDKKLLQPADISKGISYKILVYCGIYCILENILKIYPDFSKGLSKTGNISGLAKRSFTYKDFVSAVSKKKMVLGNPSIFSGYNTVEGQVKKVFKEYKLKRKSGQIVISIEADHEILFQLKELIEDSGVGTFSVGKKGLAYLDSIWED
jgi:hypothetical protein